MILIKTPIYFQIVIIIKLTGKEKNLFILNQRINLLFLPLEDFDIKFLGAGEGGTEGEELNCLGLFLSSVTSL